MVAALHVPPKGLQEGALRLVLEHVEQRAHGFLSFRDGAGVGGLVTLCDRLDGIFLRFVGMVGTTTSACMRVEIFHAKPPAARVFRHTLGPLAS